MAVGFREHVGRDEELASLLALLDDRSGLPAVAVVTGDAGIGKTTLWLAGLEAAATHGYRVLSSRPSESETRFSFAGLADLLGDAAGEVLPQLPPVQTRALEAALLLGDSEIQADQRAVAAAFLGALRILAGETPICLAVDDIQWLDNASLAALRYALARFDDEPLAALLAVRGEMPEWLRRSAPASRLQSVQVGGLSIGATHELLRARLDLTFPRPTLFRIWEASRGNPFFALELATALQRRGGTLTPGDELPIPSDLEQLLHARLNGLSAAALKLVRATAVLAEPTLTLVEAALDSTRFEAALKEALDTSILELDGERIRLTHPLLASAVVARQAPSQRRALHAGLAKLVPSTEERARHLALATTEPNTDAAAILEHAAQKAHARGAPAAAAELAEQALRLTPLMNVEDARRRLLFAADRHHAAGDTGRAVAMLTKARAEAPPGVERAAVLVELAALETGIREAVALCDQALAEAEGNHALEATVHVRLAELTGWTDGLEHGVEHAELAVRAASGTEDVALRCRAVASHATWHFLAGRGIPRTALDEAVTLERSLPEAPLVDGPSEVLCFQLVWSGDPDPTRRLLLELRDVRKTRNDAHSEARVLWHLGVLEWRAGNWEEADRHSTDSVDLITQLGRVQHLSEELSAVAVAAHRGRIDDARARGQAAIARAEAEEIHIELNQLDYGWVLGFIELSLGDANAALAHLRRSYEGANQFWLEPGMRLELGDLLEALITTGELDAADEILGTWEARAGALDRAWALAILARCRALLLAAQSDFDGAFASFERSLTEHVRSTDPFQHARTLLAQGVTQRRAKQRGAARLTLEQALAIFELLGAPLWAEKARSELARISGRTHSRDELTESERRISALVAEGRTNREVAAALFITEHTVEGALTRAYRKLGVRSRGELAHRLTHEK